MLTPIPTAVGGRRWAVRPAAQQRVGAGPFTEQTLRELRDQCRRLAATNEFAINGHENRISYIVGPGHSYRAAVCKGMDAPADVPMQVQKVLDEFDRRKPLAAAPAGDRPPHRPRRRGVSAVLRRSRRADARAVHRAGSDRDADRAWRPIRRPASAFRPIRTMWKRSWATTSTASSWMPADVQHRRANVDFNVKRGLPLYTPVRKNLRRAEKLLRNMSIVAEIQSAIALIRKHRGASRSGIEQFVAADADATVTNGTSGRTRHYSQYGPGTILDAPAGLEYDFPARGLDASSFVAVLQAELRAIAARLVMPEFMFTSDASNANYASTMVAEGPGDENVRAAAGEQIEQDRAVMWRVVDNAVAAGRLPHNVRDLVEIQIIPPSLHVRDPADARRKSTASRSTAASSRRKPGASTWGSTTTRSKRTWQCIVQGMNESKTARSFPAGHHATQMRLA